MDGKTNIVLTGVGGQGIITAANILGKAALKEKINVYISEIHGLSQRGGTVCCTVRMGNVSSPMIVTGSADVILGLEPIETLRYITYANKKTKVITDINPIIPFTIAKNPEKYPNLDDIFMEIHNNAVFYKLDALTAAKKSGSSISKNIVMLGALSATDILPFNSKILLEIILEISPELYKDINERAFSSGMKIMKNIRGGANFK